MFKQSANLVFTSGSTDLLQEPHKTIAVLNLVIKHVIFYFVQLFFAGFRPFHRKSLAHT